jgi:hypothetical protein
MNDIRIEKSEEKGNLSYRVTEPGFVYLDPLCFEVHPRLTSTTINVQKVQGGVIVYTTDAARHILSQEDMKKGIASSEVFTDISSASARAFEIADETARALALRRPDLSYYPQTKD